MHTRAFKSSTSTRNGDEIELSFASEEPYHGEILRMAGADFSRLEGGAVLLNHDRSRMVGVIRKSWRDGDKARAAITLLPTGNSDADMLRAALDAGWRGDTSVGYDYDGDDVRTMGGDEYEVNRWRALEISLVTVPADATVGMGRALPPASVDTQITIMETTASPPAATLDELSALASNALFAQVPQSDKVRAISELYTAGTTSRDAGAKFLALAEKSQLPKIDNRPALDPKDAAKYSLSRAALMSAGKLKMDGAELEAHQELTGRFRQRSPEGVCVPREIVAGKQRNNLATVNNTGGYLTQIDNRNDLLVPYLYPASIVARLGVTQLTGLINSFTLPVGSEGATAEYVGEAAAAAKSTPRVVQKSSTPKGLSAYCTRSMQLLEQGGSGVDTWLRGELESSARLKLDQVFLEGAGGAQPDGLFPLSGTHGVTFGGAATWADVLEFLSDIENTKNVISDNAKWLTNPTVARRWQSIEQVSATAVFLMDSRLPGSPAAGYDAIRSSSILTTGTYANRIAFGNWETVLLCEYFSPEIKVTEDATLARTGMVQISLLQHNDIIFTRPDALTVSTDSAAA
jgi:HK97 family phage major capsid protein